MLLPWLIVALPRMTMGDYGIPMDDHDIPMVAPGMVMVARGIVIGDHGLPRTPKAFQWVAIVCHG